jgi:hypothetical protein
VGNIALVQMNESHSMAMKFSFACICLLASHMQLIMEVMHKEGILKSSLDTAFVDGKRKIMYSDFLLYVSKAFLFGFHYSSSLKSSYWNNKFLVN